LTKIYFIDKYKLKHENCTAYERFKFQRLDNACLLTNNPVT